MWWGNIREMNSTLCYEMCCINAASAGDASVRFMGWPPKSNNGRILRKSKECGGNVDRIPKNKCKCRCADLILSVLISLSCRCDAFAFQLPNMVWAALVRFAWNQIHLWMALHVGYALRTNGTAHYAISLDSGSALTKHWKNTGNGCCAAAVASNTVWKTWNAWCWNRSHQMNFKSHIHL